MRTYIFSIMLTITLNSNASFWPNKYTSLPDAIQESNVIQTEQLLTNVSKLTPEQKTAFINLAQDVSKLRLAHMPAVSRSWLTTIGVLGFMSCIIPKIILPDIPLFSTLLNLGLLSNFCLVLWGSSRERQAQCKKARDQYQDAIRITSLIMQIPV